ncbi:MAG: hypothetical protein AB4060_08865 [Crocosphaera sp.]
MNTRYTEILLFFSRLSRRNNKGFVIGMVLASGVVMTLIAAVMLVRSSSEKEKVTVQQHTAKGMAKADVGLIRITQFLNHTEHQQLIKKDWREEGKWADEAGKIAAAAQAASGSGSGSSSIENPLDDVNDCDSNKIPGEWGNGGSSSSQSSNGGSDSDSAQSYRDEFDAAYFNEMVGKLSNSEWIEIDADDPSAGEFRLTDYQLLPSPDDPNMVQLEIEARGLDQDNSTSDLKLNNSIRKISVKLPILERSENSSNATGDTDVYLTPGLWIPRLQDEEDAKQSSDSSKPNKPINAITWVGCLENEVQENGQPKWEVNESYVNSNKLDDTPIEIGEHSINPKDPTRDGQNLGVIAIDNNMFGLPPDPPVSKLNPLDFSNCGITLPRGVSGNTWSGSSSEQCDNFQNNATDTAIGNIYYYWFQGDDSIKLSNAQIRINPPPGKKVVIFIDGGITMSGKDTFNNAQTTECRSESGNQTVVTFIGDPEDPSKLELYSRSSSKEINISGGTIISGFVHAPQTKLLISQAQVRGAAWVKQMDASNSGSDCDRSIKQMDVGQTLVMGGSPQGQPQNFTVLGQVSSYRSIEVEEEE